IFFFKCALVLNKTLRIMKYDLYNGDCIQIMRKLIDEGVKVDAIITDPPYGTTTCSWDIVIPFSDMWDCIKKIRKKNSPILIFGNEPYNSFLRVSNINEFKYDIYWQKERATNIFQLKKRPAKVIETICVFYENQPTYNPQMTIYTGPKRTNKVKDGKLGILIDSQNRKPNEYNDNGTRYPLQIVQFKRDILTSNIHPTQKPISLMEYLVKTYTNENDIVLDFTMGSGTTGIACKNLNRNFIGIELDSQYFETAKQRISNHSVDLKLFE
ncbi:MAG: DNA methyltransferase, partial [Bacteroidales bacterium]|nr:DNA methyltransferase [Bacteroidales bacterium]